MNRTTRRTAAGAAVAAMALSLAACGQSEEKPRADGVASTTVGLLLPEKTSSTRYEAFDKPLIESTVGSLCTGCVIDYANADGDEAAQKQQFDDLLAKGVKVIMLDPVNAKVTAPWVAAAEAKGAKVIAYDRLAEGKVAAYVSFDNQRTGEIQGQALLEALGPKAATAQIVMINGAESDPNAAMFKAGAHRALDGRVKKIGYEQSGEWKPEVATAKTNEAVELSGRTASRPSTPPTTAWPPPSSRRSRRPGSRTSRSAARTPRWTRCAGCSPASRPTPSTSPTSRRRTPRAASPSSC